MDARRRDDEAERLRQVVTALEEDVSFLRKRAREAPARLEELQSELYRARQHLDQASSRNDKLTQLLEEARDQLGVLREEVEKLTAPPNNFGTVLQVNSDATVDILTSGRKLRVSAQPSVEVKKLGVGQEVLLNEALNIIDVRFYEGAGAILRVREALPDGRVVLIAHGDEESVAGRSEETAETYLRAGDYVRLDTKTNLILEKMERPEMEELVLEEIPDITYEEVGGLADQIEQIRDTVELPYLHVDLFKEYELEPPKGILLYGPPGCGKTLIAKAVANSLATKVSERTGRPDVRSYFLNIKGPELLNKWVGETERQIRLIFQRAKEKSDEGVPVIVFFDEMDSLFRTRGTGISSDVESTIVPQLLSELDGVESLKNVVVIGASNREELIDPAILRPGRLDVKIKINRPDPAAAREIFRIYLSDETPVDRAELGGRDKAGHLGAMIDETVAMMYGETPNNRFLEVTYTSGDREELYFKDFASGAMIENIVQRAKKEAIKRQISGGGAGIRLDDLRAGIRQEFSEHEDLPNTTNPDDWARISGKKGERIAHVRTLFGGDEESRLIEKVSGGQYL